MRTFEELHNSPIHFDGDCVRWYGTHQPNGYGRIDWRGERILVHRLMFILNGINIPEGLVIDHLCHVRDCIKFSHLRVVTIAENNWNKDFTGIWIRKFKEWRDWADYQLLDNSCDKSHTLSPRKSVYYVVDLKHREKEKTKVMSDLMNIKGLDPRTIIQATLIIHNGEILKDRYGNAVAPKEYEHMTVAFKHDEILYSKANAA